MTSSERTRSIKPIALAFGGAIALASAMGIGRFAYTPILPEMVAALHLSASEAGLIASANFAGYLIGALVAAASFFAPRRRGWMLGALLVSALTTGAMAASASLFAFLLLRFLGGFASAFALVFTSSLVLDRLSETGRGHMAGHQFAGVGAGIAISAVLVAQLAAHHVAWQWQWLACAALSVLALAAVAILIPPRPHSTASSGSGNGATLGGALAALIVAYGLFGFGYVITATFLVQLVRTNPAIMPLEPYVWLIVGLAAVPSVPLWTMVGRRCGTGEAYAIASVVLAAGRAGERAVDRARRRDPRRDPAGQHHHRHHGHGPGRRTPARRRRGLTHHRPDDGVVRPRPDHRADLRRLGARPDRHVPAAVSRGRRAAHHQRRAGVEAYRSSVAMTSATAPAMSAGSNSACASHTNQGSRKSGSGSRP